MDTITPTTRPSSPFATLLLAGLVLFLGIALPLAVLILGVPEWLCPTWLCFLEPQRIIPTNTWHGHSMVWQGTWILVWGSAIAVFGWLFRRRSRLEVVLGAVATLLAVTVAIHLFIGLMGWQFSFDGP